MVPPLRPADGSVFARAPTARRLVYSPRMLRPLVLLLAGTLGAPPPAPVDAPEPAGTTVVPAAVPAAPVVDAEALYQQGEQAYWLGDFATAVDRFEAAYAASRLPGLLYNVGLAYMRRFELTDDPDDLQRARAVLRNYSIELEKDPSLGQAENIPKLLAQIDAQLDARRPAPAPAPAPEGPVTCPEVQPTPPPVAGPPRARRAGAALMSAGGLALVGGVTSALVLAFKGRGFGQQLASIRADQAAAGCGDMSSATCDYLADSARVTIDNGRRANLLAAGLGGGLTALGVGGLVVGAVLYGRERPPANARAALEVAPSLGGLVVSGRF